jgi:hypothetical protein
MEACAMTKKQIKQLIQKLKDAYVTCSDCGDKYGVYSVGCSSRWNGVCNVCDKLTIITETRDYAYFVTGIKQLTDQLNSHDAASVPATKPSRESKAAQEVN